MEEMKGQAKAVGTEMIQIILVKLTYLEPFTAHGDSGQIYTADSVIISTGAQARWLNLDSEKKIRVLAYLLVQHVMDFLKTKRSLWLAGVTLLLKKQCS